jgi:hypothetical protein
LVNGVLGELELPTCNFLANVINDCHALTLYLNPPGRCRKGVDVLSSVSVSEVQ